MSVCNYMHIIKSRFRKREKQYDVEDKGSIFKEYEGSKRKDK